VRRRQFESILWMVKGPFGFIPTADGLSPRLRLRSSHSVLTLQSLLTSIDHALYYTERTTWEANMRRFVDVIVHLQILSEPVGFTDMDLQDSAMWQHMLERYHSHLLRYALARPVLDRGVGMSNMWDASRFEGTMSRVVTKIRSTRDVSLPVLDPFQDQRVILPLSLRARGENF